MSAFFLKFYLNLWRIGLIKTFLEAGHLERVSIENVMVGSVGPLPLPG